MLVPMTGVGFDDSFFSINGKKGLSLELRFWVLANLRIISFLFTTMVAG